MMYSVRMRSILNFLVVWLSKNDFHNVFGNLPFQLDILVIDEYSHCGSHRPNGLIHLQLPHYGWPPCDWFV